MRQIPKYRVITNTRFDSYFHEETIQWRIACEHQIPMILVIKRRVRAAVVLDMSPSEAEFSEQAMSAVKGAMMASSRSFKGIELEPTYCYAPDVELDRGEKLAETLFAIVRHYG